MLPGSIFPRSLSPPTHHLPYIFSALAPLFFAMEPSADQQYTSRQTASSATIFTPSSACHSSKETSTHYPSHYASTNTTLHQHLDLSPNSYPFGLGSSPPSVSNGIRVEQGEQDLPLDFYLDSEGGRTFGSGSSGSGVDDFGGFFNGFERYNGRGSASSTSSASLGNLTPPSASLPPTSTRPLPSPLPTRSFDSSCAAGWSAGEWDSESPFSSEGLSNGEGGGSTKPSVGFTIIKSLEETRTPQ